MRWRRAVAAGLAAVVLGGCMVGPDYKRPSVLTTPTYKEAEGWKAASPSDHLPRGPWWTIFGDRDLDALEDQIGPANQNLKIAEARLREARALVRFNRAALFPTISTSVGASSIRESANQPFRSGVNLGSSGDLLLSLEGGDGFVEELLLRVGGPQLEVVQRQLGLQAQPRRLEIPRGGLGLASRRGDRASNPTP